MYTAKPNIQNFQLCQRLLAEYKLHGSSIPQQELQKFIWWADRNTLRRECHFKPLQQLMLKMTPRLLQDAYFTRNAAAISKTTSIYCYLNLHQTQWMDRVCEMTLRSLPTIQLDEISLIYRAFIELKNRKHPHFMTSLRQTYLRQLLAATDKHKERAKFLWQVENIHRYLRNYMLDPDSPKQAVAPLLHKIQQMFQQIQPEIISKDYTYHRSAFLYELLTVFGVSKLISGKRYLHFMQNCFEKNQQIPNAARQSSNYNFERRGESVFQIRFQRHLQENGYWFERNKRVGLHQFDIILKGRLSEQHRPFAHLNLQALKKGTVAPITQTQLAVFQKMDSLWLIQQQKKWPLDKIVNLNGPFHFITGDSSGLIRSQAIKRDILRHYGYTDFMAIDYQQWERETTNQKGVRQFLSKHFGQ